MDKDILEEIYEVCNEIFKDDELFYTKEELEKLKQDKENVFLWKEWGEWD